MRSSENWERRQKQAAGERRGQAFDPKLLVPPLCFPGILEWYSPLAPSLPQLSQAITTTIPLQPQGERESFVPLHHPPFTSLSLMVVVAYWVVHWDCINLHPFFFFSPPWPIGLRTQQETYDVWVVLLTKASYCKMWIYKVNTETILWSWRVSIEMHLSYYGLSGVISVIQADRGLYWEKCAIVFSFCLLLFFSF